MGPNVTCSTCIATSLRGTSLNWNTDLLGATEVYGGLYSNEILNTTDNTGQEDHIPLVNRNSNNNETYDKHNNSTTGATSFQAALSIAKAVMGAGSFALSWSFKQQLLVSCRYLAFELALLRRKAKEEINGNDYGNEEEDYDVTHNKDVGSKQIKEEKMFFASSYVDIVREAFSDVGAFATCIASVLSSVGQQKEKKKAFQGMDCILCLPWTGCCDCLCSPLWEWQGGEKEESNNADL
eukprot:15330347-Ditylum_brightwellii.AAC.1